MIFCIILNSCQISENIVQRTSEVDFSTPLKVQISFNEHIYNTTLVLKDCKFEMNFIDEKDLLDGAYVCLSEISYKITYKDMAFNGEKSDLTSSFLPCIIYSFFNSFNGEIVFDSYDKERESFFVKRNINGYFIVLECYEGDNSKFYSMEIK